MSYNLSEIRIEDSGIKMSVRHPGTDEILIDNEGNQVTLMLAGADSETYRKASNLVSNRRVKSRRNALNAERLQADSLELICRCTLSWSNLEVDGKVPETAEEVYKDRVWLKEQADAFIHDRVNYLGN